MSDKQIVICGSGHAGVQAAAQLSELGWGGRTVLVDQDDTPPYERPPLSKDVLNPGKPGGDTRLLRVDHFYTDRNIDRISGKPVIKLDRVAKEIELSDGERLPYHKLIIASGSKPRQLNLPGAELPGVYTLKTRTDALVLRRSLRSARCVAIIGAGYIGLEVATAAAELGCDVTVFELQNRVMSRVTSDVVAQYFEELHVASGTSFVFGTSVTDIKGQGTVERVVTSDGTVHEADVVVVGIGIVPNQTVAEGAGIVCSDGIVVDEHCRTSDPDVYAVGDVARFASETEPRGQRLESVQSAVSQAITASNHIVMDADTKREIPWFWTVQHNVRLQTAGLRRDDDDVVVRGNIEDGRFSVLYIRDGRLAAIDTVGSLKDFIPGKKLIAAETTIDATLASDPSIKLAQTARQGDVGGHAEDNNVEPPQ